MKRGLLALSSIVLINFASASLTQELKSFASAFEPQTVFLALVFFAVFTFAYFSMNKILQNTLSAAIIAAAVAMGAAYGFATYNLIPNIDFSLNFEYFIDDLEWFFISNGVPEIVAESIFPILTIGIGAFLLWMLGYFVPLGLGVFFFFGSLFGLIYDKSMGIILGMVFLFIGFWLWSKKGNRDIVGRDTSKLEEIRRDIRDKIFGYGTPVNISKTTWIILAIIFIVFLINVTWGIVGLIAWVIIRIVQRWNSRNNTPPATNA